MAQTNNRTADIIRQIQVVVATIFTIAFNGISQALPIGNQTSADVSNRNMTFFTPANYAFSIWGVIYLLLLVYAVYQALPAQRTNPNARKIAWPFILSCVLNCVWITLFQYNQFVLSVIVIVAFLLSLMYIYVTLNIGHAQVSNGERWALHVPFSVYLGWLSVATIANISVLGVANNWGDLFGIAQPTWAAIMLVVATLVGIILAVTRRDVAYVLVFVWAFTAIVSKQAATPIVANTAVAMVIVLLVVLVGSIFLNMRRGQPLVPIRA